MTYRAFDPFTGMVHIHAKHSGLTLLSVITYVITA